MFQSIEGEIPSQSGVPSLVLLEEDSLSRDHILYSFLGAHLCS